MNTIVHRIDNNHDVDDGIYFDVSKKPEVSVATIQGWIHDAVDEQTTMETQERKNCVRVQYKDDYHVDFPIYYQIGNDCPMLGYKSNVWKSSDPIAFIEWFEGKTTGTNGQLRNMVRYAKAWLDYQIIRKNLNKGDDLKGISLTILVTENYSKDDRDDVAFLNTIKNIHSKLSSNYKCERPTEPAEDLFADTSKESKEKVLSAFKTLIDSGDEAMEAPVEKDACRKWKSQFGPRFNCDNVNDQLPEAIKFSSPALIRSTGNSA